LCRYASGRMQGLLESGMWWLVISTWKQSQPQSKQQEAKRKQKALDILASARRIGFEISHRTCLTTKQPNLFDHRTPNLFNGCHRLPLPRKIYMAGHLGLISLSSLMYYLTSLQAIRYIVIRTRESIDQHCQGNSYTISLGWCYNSTGKCLFIAWYHQITT
jgi:hypothetical protein